MKRFKKTLAIGVAVTTISVLAACGDDETPEVNDGEDAPETEEVETNEDGEEGEAGEAAPEEDGEPIATVNGEEVPRDQYDMQMMQVEQMYAQQGVELDDEEVAEEVQMMQQNIVEQLVDQELLVQEAQNQNIDVSDEQVEETLDELIEAQFEDRDQYEEALEQSGLTEDELKEDIRQQLAVEELITLDHLEEDAIEVNDEEVEQAYEEIAQQNPEADFDEMEDDLRQNLKLEKYIDQLREDADIEINV
ncbi:SurA N-terminal domain-containing protein [Alteribacter keqinensis]|uniref:peptidylprolyl isomerase n=1 Tax=Alteribacter keqinensis TaxID=2483800 RepID=A0A3M7TW13_9BACI|nr:SurA N-terminal domain-containing protein [Alteribacter keqinensis]RNA69102.1 hypothetical protein EBO34_03875 [Alteribacter keqinensis]